MSKHNTILQRFAALIIDLIVLAPLGVIVISLQNELTQSVSAIYSSQVFIGLSVVIYFVTLNAIKGKTVGKKICKIKVVSMSENNITLSQSIFRSLPAIFLLFFLVIIQASAASPENPINKLLLLYGNNTILILLALWVVANLIVMTSNIKDRAIQDFLAKTIVVKTG